MTEDRFLQPVDDGLDMRESQEYARMKLKALEYYLDIVTTSMREKWSALFYIDLQAGPGKNRIGNDIVLGSPLLSLQLAHPFTHYRFNELDQQLADVLRQRVSASPLSDRVHIYQQDVNEVVHEICDEIDRFDKQPKAPGIWSSLNVAFIDPEGLELHWATIERLARVRKMDLIINFSTSGIVRSEGRGNIAAVDTFYGNVNWHEDMKISDTLRRRRALIERYLGQLQSFGYYTEENPDIEHLDISFRNSKNAEVYSLIFASKHELGNKFWLKAKRGSSPPRLPGF